MTLKNDHYTYRVTWSEDDGEYVGLCAEFPSLSWLADEPETALKGIREVVAEIVNDMKANNETLPEAIAGRHYSGRLSLRIPTDIHRNLAIKAAETGISLNRLARIKLTE